MNKQELLRRFCIFFENNMKCLLSSDYETCFRVPPIGGLPLTHKSDYYVLAYFLVYGRADNANHILRVLNDVENVSIQQPQVSKAVNDFEELGWMDIIDIPDADTRNRGSRKKYVFTASRDEVYEDLASGVRSAIEERKKALTELTDLIRKHYS